MESNNNYVIIATTDWHQAACIAHFVISNYTFLMAIVNQLLISN